MELFDNELEVARLYKASEEADAQGRWFTGGTLRAQAHEMQQRLDARLQAVREPVHEETTRRAT